MSGVQTGLQQEERDRRVLSTSILAAILCKVVGVPEIIDSETLDVLPNLYSIRNRAEMQGTDICFCLIYKTFTT